MSEPDQLFGRLHLSRQRFEDFINAAVPEPAGDEAVLEWLAGAKYYGDSYTPEKIRAQVDATTAGEWAAQITGPGAWGFAVPSRNEYDDATQTWTIAALDFSENYDDFIAAVAVFRAASRFKDLPGEDGLVVYGYMFGSSEPTVVLRVDEGSSAFVEGDETRGLLAQASAVMEELMAEGAARAAEMGEA